MPLSSLPDFLDRDGQTRRLGYVRPDPSKKMMRASRANIQTIRTQSGLSPLIKPGDPDWREVDYVTGYPGELITNQGQEGSCTAWSCTGSQARQRYMRERKVLVCSGYYVYDCINHGHDNGSNIIDSMTTIETIGAPTIAAYPKCKYPGHVPSLPEGTDMYKEDVAITGATALEFATMLLMGMLPQGPIYVTSSFENWTPDGVAWGNHPPNSSNSNHSVYFGGIKFLNGPNDWYLRLVNSWGLNWGPFKNGTCLCPPAAVDNAADADDGYAHANTIDPVDSQGVAPEPLI